eukprot:825078-Heterocapsa_arctica.AAC.1
MGRYLISGCPYAISAPATLSRRPEGRSRPVCRPPVPNARRRPVVEGCRRALHDGANARHQPDLAGGAHQGRHG